MQNQFRRLLSIAWLLASAFTPSNADTSDIDPTLIWTNPDGRLVDFDSTLVYKVGDVVVLQWDPWPYENVINSTGVWADLWLTAHDSTSFSPRRLDAHIDLETDPGSFKWLVDVPATDVAAIDGWYLRFSKEADTSDPTYETTDEDEKTIRTPGFRIVDRVSDESAATTSTTSSETTSTTSSTAVPSPTAPESLATTTAPVAVVATPANNIGMKSPGGLSEGAKAGIGAGVGIGAASLFAIAALLWFLNRKKKPVNDVQDSKYESVPNVGPLPHSPQPSHSAVSPNSTYVSPHASVGYYAPVLQKGPEQSGPVEMPAPRPNNGPVEMA